MAVTITDYTLSAPWAFQDCIDAFEQAFIDAGWMTAWFDAYTVDPPPPAATSLEYRVMEIEYFAGRTYGKTYVHFKFLQFDSTNVLVSGFTTTSHNPAAREFTGTRYQDWPYASDSRRTGYNSSTDYSWFIGDNGQNNFVAALTTDFTIKRFATSDGIQLIQVSYSSVNSVFTMFPANTTFSPLIEDATNYACVCPFLKFIHAGSVLEIKAGPPLGKSIPQLAVNTTGPSDAYFSRTDIFPSVMTYTTAFDVQGSTSGAVVPTYLDHLLNDNFMANNSYKPVFYNFALCTYASFSSTDLGLFQTFDSSVAANDTIVVDPGINEWLVLIPGELSLIVRTI